MVKSVRAVLIRSRWAEGVKYGESSSAASWPKFFVAWLRVSRDVVVKLVLHLQFQHDAGCMEWYERRREDVSE